MSDPRSQLVNLSDAEKVELLDAVWESLEADAQSLTERSGRSWTPAWRGTKKILPMSFPGKKSGHAYSISHDTSGAPHLRT